MLWLSIGDASRVNGSRILHPAGSLTGAPTGSILQHIAPYYCLIDAELLLFKSACCG
jgi:hypothetical protein